MIINNTRSSDKSLHVVWEDGSETEFPYIWLRDNDMNELHPQTHERVFDLCSVSLNITPEHHCVEAGSLKIQWPNKHSISVYTASWLHCHQPGSKRIDPANIDKVLWDTESHKDIESFNAKSCLQSNSELQEMLLCLKQNGLLLIDGLADNSNAGAEFGSAIGFKRESNFGVMFDVISQATPVNLAYTSVALPLHTDLPNQSMVPSYQFLHCYLNTVVGGESVFADGFKICADLAEQEPIKFELLKNTKIPWRFHDQDCDIRSHRSIINLGADGTFESLVFNAHLADVPDMSVETLHDFYAAYQDLMQRIRNPKYAIYHHLKPSQMVVFDNQRVLHSRTEFDPNSGERHLRGYYIDNNEIDSKIRKLELSKR
jgi:gamma-butyrobetaine dioxygenase